MSDSSSDDLASDTPRSTPGSLSEHIGQNIESVVALQRREWEQIRPSQRRIEWISRIIGRVAFLVGVLGFTVGWVGINLGAERLGFTAFDPPPFALLDGILTLIALVTTIIVLIAQNRQTRLEQQRAHLDLQVNLLTEQKVTKLIQLLEELRHDLPMVQDREDPHAALLQEGADTAKVVSALEDGLTDEATP